MNLPVPADIDLERVRGNRLQALMDEALEQSDHPVELIEAAATWGVDGELYFVAKGAQAKACLFEGRVAWINCSTHGEHFGCVLERETGLTARRFAQAMKDARARHIQLGAWLVERGLITQPRLRGCLEHHLAAHLGALARMAGDYEVAFVRRKHRYDRALTFELLDVIGSVVHQRIGSAFAFADHVVLIDGSRRRVVGPTRGKLDKDEVFEIGRRVEGYCRKVQAITGAVVFRTSSSVLCAQRLQTHPRLLLTIASRDPSKIGLMMQHAMSLKGEI